MSSKDTPESPGKPPKSNAEIRGKLQAIQKTADVKHVSGKMRDGMNSSHPILIASFHNRDFATTFQRLLGQEGIFGEEQIRNEMVHITVDYQDSESAAQLASDFRVLNPDPIPASRKRRFEIPVLATIMTTVFAGVVIDFDHASPECFMFLITCAGIGLCVGLLIDRLYRCASSNAFLFGIFDILVVVSLVALTIALLKVAPSVI